MEFIDTHTHLSDPAFSDEADAAVLRALQAGVHKMLLADIDSSERKAMHELAGRHPGVLYKMAGLYPGSVRQDWRQEVDKVCELAASPDIVAIGEIGLDYHWSTEFKTQQQDALKAQLDIPLSALPEDLLETVHLGIGFGSAQAVEQWLETFES